MITLLLILTLLFTKHFVADFVYQPPYQWQNKGKYGHPGGLIHTLQHVAATGFILAWFGIPFTPFAIILVGEAIVHYHTDWAKMNINAKYGWGANTHAEFWILTGFDQWIHAMTYMAIAFYLAVGGYV